MCPAATTSRSIRWPAGRPSGGFSGSTNGRVMTLSVTLTDTAVTLGPVQLELGKEPRWGRARSAGSRSGLAVRHARAPQTLALFLGAGAGETARTVDEGHPMSLPAWIRRSGSPSTSSWVGACGCPRGPRNSSRGSSCGRPGRRRRARAGRRGLTKAEGAPWNGIIDVLAFLPVALVWWCCNRYRRRG